MTDVTELANSPGVVRELIEGGLAVTTINRAPRVLVLGVAGNGQADTPYVVGSSSIAASEFGSAGTLTRGMYETKIAGADNVILYRIGSTSAKLEHVGDSLGVGGYTIETLRKDDDAGGLYSVYYDDSDDRLVVWNTTSGTVVYDNDATDPIDTGEVIVSGSKASGGGPDIAGPSAGIALEDVVAAGHTGTAYTAGTDGSNPSRMELYEYLYRAYKDLIGDDFDFVVPMDIYLDDKNTVDGDVFTASYIAGIVSGGTYPTAASDDDILGKLFVEEYQGEYYFFWDLNNDGDAELWPDGVGSASATLKISGDSLSSADFHEVNFAHQLAYFCHEVSTNGVECLGTIGVKPPASRSRPDLTAWIGMLPSFTVSNSGVETITTPSDNGTGLLGNKLMAGSYSFRAGTAYGGFILTDSEFLDGIEETDSNGEYIDIGKHLSVVAAYVRLFNALDSTGRGYAATAAPTYMGLVSKMDEKSAPTNKVIRGVQQLFTISPRLVDRLNQVGYVYIFEKPKGLVVADAPTGARPLSDFRRLMTMRIVKKCIDVFRDRADPFIGEAANAAMKAALETSIRGGLDKLIGGGYITRYELSLLQTPVQKVIGDMTAELIVVPCWELRRIRLVLSLKPE